MNLMYTFVFIEKGPTIISYDDGIRFVEFVKRPIYGLAIIRREWPLFLQITLNSGKRTDISGHFISR